MCGLSENPNINHAYVLQEILQKYLKLNFLWQNNIFPIDVMKIYVS